VDVEKIFLIGLSKGPPSLEHLDMSRNDLSLYLSELLVVGLSKFPSLVDVDMKLNWILKLGFCNEYVFPSTKLRKLNLDFNPILRLFIVILEEDTSPQITFVDANPEF
jgi:hypothetical protein